MRFYALCLLALGTSALSVRTQDGACLPVIDLGYNVRYAKSPTGDMRFRAPKSPVSARDEIQTGSEARTCPQGSPMWQGKAYGPIARYTNPNVEFKMDQWIEDIRNSVPRQVPNAGPVTEDCLFLDVHVPKAVLERASDPTFDGVPILFWIHGGGYVLGSKLGYPVPGYYPDGIMSKAAADGTATGIIFVTINYRLGALGFLSGPEMMLEGGELNAGLLDQRFALEWVQEHIGLFGGDKNRVTVMGESAGGGSVFAHLAAYGGDKGGVKLFSGAIAQSPAFVPLGITPPGSYNAFLQHVGVGNLTEARAVDEATIIAANAATIGDAPASSYIFCPVVDGDLLPGNLATLLRQGRFDKSIPVLAAHNSLEGGFFFDPNIASEEAFEAWVNKSVPGLGANRLKYLSESLYPPIFDGSLGYLNMSMRQMSLLGEAIFDCNFNTIGEALDGNSFAYQFAVSPGIHIQDLTYTFNSRVTPAPFPKAQRDMQQAIASFVLTGVPSLGNGTVFPRWGEDRSMVEITTNGGQIANSQVNETRCAWWSDLGA